jgi:hypothetical protein
MPAATSSTVYPLSSQSPPVFSSPDCLNCNDIELLSYTYAVSTYTYEYKTPEQITVIKKKQITLQNESTQKTDTLPKILFEPVHVMYRKVLELVLE